MKKINFKAGNIIKHTISRSVDNFEIDHYGESRFTQRSTFREEETLLIVGYDKGFFILFTIESNAQPPRARKFFKHGGFEKCFKMSASYINGNCTFVS